MMESKPNLSVKWVCIDVLKEFEKNPRKHSVSQVEKVSDSIKEFGFVQPILVGKGNVIIAGHCRLLGAKLLGMKSVPCIHVEDLSESAERSLRIAHNKLALDSEWNDGFLIEEFSDLQDSGFDLDLTGFEEVEIKELVGIEEENKSDDGVSNVKQLGKHVIQCPKCQHKFKRGEKTSTGNNTVPQEKTTLPMEL